MQLTAVFMIADTTVITGSQMITLGADVTIAEQRARHYDFVLLHLHPELPAATTIQGLTESDLAYVLLQPSTQNFYDFELLRRRSANGPMARAAM